MKQQTNCILIKPIWQGLFALVLLVSLLPLLAGCGGPKPTEPVDSFFTSLARCDFSTAQKYLTEPLDWQSFGMDLLPLLQAAKQTEGKVAIYDNLAILMAATKWQVTDSQTKGETATLSVTLTTYDFTRLYQKVLADSNLTSLQQLTKDNLSTTLETLRNSLAEEAKQQPLPTITREVTVTLEKVGQKWKISSGTAFFDVVSNGLYTQIQQ